MAAKEVVPLWQRQVSSRKDHWVLQSDCVTEQLCGGWGSLRGCHLTLCFSKSAMCATVICSMVLCLLGVGKSLFWVVSSLLPCHQCPPGLGLQLLSALFPGSLDAEVTQTPGHLIKGQGQNVKMSCVPPKGHRYVYWYQQILAKEFKFLVSFQDKNVFETEMPKNRFSAEYPQNSPCSLEIRGTELQDSATYLCASSEPTLLNISSP